MTVRMAVRVEADERRLGCEVRMRLRACETRVFVKERVYVKVLR